MDHMARCDQFVEYTNTDKALAMMYLQDRDWDVQRAVSDFFADEKEGISSSTGNDKFIDLTGSDDSREIQPVVNRSPILTLLSWNIDGLDKSNFVQRMTAICTLIKSEQPHIVCLQEVVLPALELLRPILHETYHIFSASDDPFSECANYFVAILICRRPFIHIDQKNVTVMPFETSSMGRHLVSLDISLDVNQWLSGVSATSTQPVNLRIYTSHLESCQQSSSERKNQLKLIWSKMSRWNLIHLPSDSSRASLFCGDLNIRDSEINQLGGVPQGILDVWEETGAHKHLHATWDPKRNFNAGRFQSYILKSVGCRFDRIYCAGKRLKPVDFGLRGLEKLPQSQCFPSDHWGVLGRFLIS